MPTILDRLRRHPFAVEAFFDYTVVLTYALPAELLQRALPAPLEVDRHDDLGFLAIALVKTRAMRPKGFPERLGRNFFLSGYRVFCRFPTQGKRLRGLKILRSDTDSRLMVVAGNLMTHYRYHHVQVRERRFEEGVEVEVRSRDGATDLHLVGSLKDPQLPPTSPFSDWRQARKWCGPLPFTFSPEVSSGKMVVVQGVRQQWTPRPLEVQVHLASFLATPLFAGEQPVLANAFLVDNVPYWWKRGELL